MRNLPGLDFKVEAGQSIVRRSVGAPHEQGRRIQIASLAARGGGRRPDGPTIPAGSAATTPGWGVTAGAGRAGSLVRSVGY